MLYVSTFFAYFLSLNQLDESAREREQARGHCYFARRCARSHVVKTVKHGSHV